MGLSTRTPSSPQLLYEIGDPCRYITPDVIVEFTSVQLHDAGRTECSSTVCSRRGADRDVPGLDDNARRVQRLSGQLTVVGPDAGREGELTASLLFSRLAREGVQFAESIRSSNASGPAHALTTGRAGSGKHREVGAALASCATQIAVASTDGAWSSPSLLLSGPPGLTGFAGGRPKASDGLGALAALVDRSRVLATVTVRGGAVRCD